MDFVVVLFVFILPLAALIMSMYCLFYIRTMKKAASKFSAMSRIAGKDLPHE